MLIKAMLLCILYVILWLFQKRTIVETNVFYKSNPDKSIISDNVGILGMVLYMGVLLFSVVFCISNIIAGDTWCFIVLGMITESLFVFSGILSKVDNVNYRGYSYDEQFNVWFPKYFPWIFVVLLYITLLGLLAGINSMCQGVSVSAFKYISSMFLIPIGMAIVYLLNIKYNNVPFNMSNAISTSGTTTYTDGRYTSDKYSTLHIKQGVLDEINTGDKIRMTWFVGIHVVVFVFVILVKVFL